MAPRKGKKQNNQEIPENKVIPGNIVNDYIPSYSQMATYDRTARKELLGQMNAVRADDSISAIAGWKNYLQKMRELDALMDRLSVLDSYGIPKPVSAEDKASLETLMRETALAGETFLNNAKEESVKDPEIRLDKGVPGAVGQLQGLLSHDFRTIQAYDPAEKELSLPELMEESRTKTITLGKTQIKAMGGAQSSRIPMTLVNEKGGKRRGFLTKSKVMDLKKNWDEAVGRASANQGTVLSEQILKGFLEEYRDYKKIDKDKSEEYVIAHLLATTFDEKTPSNSAMNFKVLLAKMKIKATDIGIGAINILASAMTPLNTTATAYNAMGLGLKDGDRIDRRNSAMSAVAELFGKPNLLAGATDIRFTDDEGKILEGTFMDYADGLDLGGSSTKPFTRIADDPYTNSSRPGAFLKQLADLQALDFLCGNLDRHFANLTYLVDENGKLIGVQGIDNDSSWGCNAPGAENVERLAGTANLGVISESMAKKIKDTTPEMLKFELRGKGLSEEQMDYAVLRLNQLKEAIQKGKEHYNDKPIPKKGLAYEEGFIRTVSDKEFAELSIDRLCPETTDKMGWYKNLFGEVGHKMDQRIRQARKNGANFIPENARRAETDKLTQVDTAAKTLQEKLDPKNFRDSLKGIGGMVTFGTKARREELGGAKNVDELTHGRNGSPQFADMVKAVKKLDALETYFDKLKKDGVTLTGQEYKRYYDSVKDAVQTVKDTQSAYIRMKMEQRNAKTSAELTGKNDYERSRIKYAKNVGQFVNRLDKNLNKLEKPESILADKEEIRAQQEMRDLADRKAALEALRKLHEEQGLASPEALQQAKKNKDQDTVLNYKKQVEEKSKAAQKNKQPGIGR